MRSRACSRFALLFSVSAALATPVAVTLPARAAGDDAMIEMARERFQEGVKYYDDKQYEKARAAFLQAYALKRHPAVLLNLAQSELRSGHEADAAKHYAIYLREHKEASALEKQEAEKGLAAAKTKVGEVAVTVDQDGAEVFVDGQPEGRTPLAGPVYLEPGQHSIEARKDGKTATSSVTTKAGASTAASLSLAGGGGGAVAPVPADGGGGSSETPPTGGAGTPPEEDTGGGFEVDTKGPREPFFSWAKSNKVAWVGGGITVIGLAGGVVFALTSKSAYDSADQNASDIRLAANEDGIDGPCDPASRAGLSQERKDQYVDACTKYQDNADAGDSRKTLSIVSFVVAGVAAAGTVVYYFVDSAPKKSAATRDSNALRVGLYPVVAPGHQGFGLIGQF
jgi:hypothetical protein